MSRYVRATAVLLPTRYASRVPALGLLLLGLTACGGGGSGGDGGTSPLVQSYHSVLFLGGDTDQRSVVEWGLFDADGVSALAGTVAQNRHPPLLGEPRVVSGVSVGPMGYTIQGDGELSVQGDRAFRGRVTSDGQLALLTPMGPGDNPGLWLLLRRAGMFDAASLTGFYLLVSLVHDLADHSASVGTIEFQGDGTGSMITQTNKNGTETPPAGPLPISYQVQADGAVTLDLGVTYQGGMLAGGDVVVLGGRTTAGPSDTDRGIVVLVKASTSASVASLQGRFRSAWLWTAGLADDWTVWYATQVFDGIGQSFSEPGLENEDGAVDTFGGTGSVSYEVQAGGLVTTPGYLGAVSPDGRFAALASVDPAVPGRPQIRVMLKE